MSIQTTNCQNCGSFIPGRNSLVPVSSHYSIPNSQPPFIISQGAFVNNNQQNYARSIHSDIEIPKFNKNGRALGAVHIMIGLLHIGLGIILGLLAFTFQDVLGFASLTFLGGYPFWGGLTFIVTGVLTAVGGAKQGRSCLVKSILAMSIVSAIFSIIGLILLLIDEIINGLPQQDIWAVISGKGISALLFIFSLVELSISSVTANFATRAINKNRHSF